MSQKDWTKKTNTKREITWMNKNNNHEVTVISPYRDKSIWIWWAMDNNYNTIEGNRKFHTKQSAMERAKSYMRSH